MTDEMKARTVKEVWLRAKVAFFKAYSARDELSDLLMHIGEPVEFTHAGTIWTLEFRGGQVWTGNREDLRDAPIAVDIGSGTMKRAVGCWWIGPGDNRECATPPVIP